MDSKTQQENLMLFCEALPFETVTALGAKNIDIFIGVSEIGARNGLVLYETGNICEGVLKVLKGEESPSNFVAFIEKDERIEEDNRPKIKALAYEIQTKIFDIVLPILRQAGMTVKEGRVAEPPKTASSFQVSGSSQDTGARFQVQGSSEDTGARFQVQGSSQKPLEARSQNLTASSGGLEARSLKLEASHIRALVRIAAGTSYSEQQLKDAFLELPKGLRQSLSSVDTANAIQAIARKYMLHVDQMASLASETGLVLLGLTHPAEFISHLATRLRVQEDAAKEIGREVSAQILGKVREALRGLHEESQKSEVRSPKQIQDGESSKSEVRTTPLATQSTPGGLNGSINTPYSAGAKWNTGENILARQAEGKLSRMDILRGVEHPVSSFQVLGASQNTGSSQNKLEASGLKPEASPVGPTGWKPRQNEVGSMNYELGKTKTTAISESPLIRGALPSSAGGVLQPTPRGLGTPFVKEQQPTPPKTAAPPLLRGITTPAPIGIGVAPFIKGDGEGGRGGARKIRPQSEVAFPQVPQKPRPEPQDFLEQKLNAPMAMPKEERRYTSDPYREPLG